MHSQQFKRLLDHLDQLEQNKIHQVMIDAENHGVIGPFPVKARSKEEAIQRAIKRIRENFAKIGYELVVRSARAR